MNKDLEINAEIGLCTKEMAHDNPIKDFEILVEEYKDKWSEQMYDYFKECINVLKNKEKAFDIIKNKDVQITLLKNTKNYEQYNHGLLVYMTKTSAKKMFLTKEQYDLVKEAML